MSHPSPVSAAASLSAAASVPAASVPAAASPSPAVPASSVSPPASPAARRSASAPAAGRAYVTVASPVGLLTLVAAGGALVGLYMEDHRHGPLPAALGAPGDAADEPFAAAARQLAAYFAGKLTAFDLPLAPEGTEFQRQVWMALRAIPYGRTVSYGALAAQLGRPGASRAVGLANGRNPISIVVPCHRVIGADGSMTGYGGGVPRKLFLLDLERSATL